ncbi:MAG TPA: hypothetical protein VFT65_02690 [Candidatus Angelobacter sp.]|nr:hypothetical protein [Candidatus Angelobacter sp.]
MKWEKRMSSAGFSRFIYFSLHRLIGSELARDYREFLELERQSPAYVAQLRSERLRDLLAHACANVPFYRDRVEARPGLELNDFPILRKEDIRQNSERLMSPEVHKGYLSGKTRAQYSWLAVQTGGSTGMPTTVIHDRRFRDLNRAARLYTQRMCGFPIGKPYFKLWGSMREINDSRGSMQQRVAGFLAGEIVMNAFRMEDRDMDSFLRTINASSIEHMMAYSDAAYRFGQYLLARKLKVRPLKSVMACAATLTEEMRHVISRAFGGATVQNMYGSRDCGAIACECAQGSLHIFENKVVLETVDDQGKAVAVGKPGRILVTLLGNHGFPLIRYEIGDVGVLSAKSCSCGLPTRILDRVEGRSVEFLVTENGGYISPSYFVHLIGVVHNPGVIRRFQIVQQSVDHAVLSLEQEPGAEASVLREAVEKIRRDLLTVFGPRMNLQIEMVSRIQESASGKFIVSINKTGQPAAR